VLAALLALGLTLAVSAASPAGAAAPVRGGRPRRPRPAR